MEPKDLKNSKELKRTENENKEQTIVPEKTVANPKANDEVVEVEKKPSEPEVKETTAEVVEEKTSKDEPETKVDPEEVIAHRITSYNVCYTKLLRRLTRSPAGPC